VAPQVEGEIHRPDGATTAFLLIHGFAANTDQMKSLVEFLAVHKIASFSVKLPGHGGTPEELSKVNRTDWYNCVKDALNLVKSWNVERIFVAGLSMGGALSLRLSADSEGIDGLVVLSPAVYQRGLIQKFIPLLKIIMPYRDVNLSYISEMYDIPYSRVNREPLSALQEVIGVMKDVQKILQNVTLPTLVIQSGADKTIDPGNGQYVYDRIGSVDKEIHIIADAEHVITCHSKRKEAYALIQQFITRLNT